MAELPQKNVKDYGYGFVSSIVKLLPGGAILSFLLESIITPSLEKRRQIWFQSVNEALETLQNEVKNFKPTSIEENEEFTTIFIHSTNLALKTHEKGKIERLKNGFINSVRLINIDFEEKMRFFRAIEEFQIPHMKLLEEIEINKLNSKSLIELKDSVLKNTFQNNYSLFHGAFTDLYNFGFIEKEFNKELKIEDKDIVTLSKLGKHFIKFIQK